ncbi:MAG: 3-keto-disaccharide hydrolase [Terriglobia bacterium]
MRRCVIGIGILAFLAFAAVIHGHSYTVTKSKARHGWKLLFDGQSLKGWQAHVGGDWRIEGGALVCPGTSSGWLNTTVSSNNYVLKLEFRGAGTINSGVFLRAQEEGRPWISGYECQIWDYQPGGFDTGSLVGSVKALPTKIIPNRWNRYEITVDGDRFVVVLNGKTILDAHNSKHLTGDVIGLQCNRNNRIEFRDIEFMPLAK